MKKLTCQISIPKPCSESWENMQTNAQGRFCESCAKTVVDFSKMSDEAILKFLQKNSQHACGRFRNDQLNRPINPIQYQSGVFNWKPLAASVLLTLGIKSALAQTPKIQTPKTEQSTNYEDPNNYYTSIDSITHFSTYFGQLIGGETEDVIPFAIILISGETIATITDIDGYFKIQVPDYLLHEHLSLTISSVGYQSVTIPLTGKSDFLKIKLSNSFLGMVGTYKTYTLGGEFTFETRKWWQFWK